MNIVHGDSVFRVEPGTPPDYNQGNSLLKVLGLVERTRLAAEREHYTAADLQYLFPVNTLELYGPSGADADLLDPTRQDNKTDFQKQNVRDFHAADTVIVRGLVSVADWRGPFVRVSYRGGPDSKLSTAANHQLGDTIKLWLKVGAVTGPTLLPVPYNQATNRYEIELWADPGIDLSMHLGTKGRAALERGELLVRGDLVRGRADDFQRDELDGKDLTQVAPDNTMHPILPLHIELAWTDAAEQHWDSQEGENYHYEFNMIVRGWDSYLGIGASANPHGGVGLLEYRNLLTNYYYRRRELGRQLEPWNLDAFGSKEHAREQEDFFAVDYMDLHILKPSCGIGLHRHRDNQEVFLMLEGRGYMVIGDWCKLAERERCLEVRSLRSGHLAMLKGGNLHGLMNPSDENMSLFMFGGYD